MRAALTVLALACATACGGPVDTGSGGFSSEASQVVQSTHGLELRLFEQVGHPLARGVNQVRVEVSGDVESLELTPWMPVMGHGSTVRPTIERDESGFIISSLTLAMPGQWELRCALHGGVDDDAIFNVEVR